MAGRVHYLGDKGYGADRRRRSVPEAGVVPIIPGPGMLIISIAGMLLRAISGAGKPVHCFLCAGSLIGFAALAW